MSNVWLKDQFLTWTQRGGGKIACLLCGGDPFVRRNATLHVLSKKHKRNLEKKRNNNDSRTVEGTLLSNNVHGATLSEPMRMIRYELLEALMLGNALLTLAETMNVSIAGSFVFLMN